MSYIDKIKSLILKDIKLHNVGLPSDYTQWRQSDFIRLATIMQQYWENNLSAKEKNSFGSTISISTLERFFKGDYNVSFPLDLRKQKTLDKLCIFLGYQHWLDFLVRCCGENEMEGLCAQLDQIKAVVKNAIYAEFEAYKSLPNLQTQALDAFFVADSAAKTRILNVLNRLHSRNWIITNELNPSTIELLSIEARLLSETEAEVITKEYWYLRWYEIATNETTYIYNETNEQIYRLQKEGEQWKIKVNAYPPPKKGDAMQGTHYLN